MDTLRLEYLLQSFSQKTLTYPEREELLDWIGDPGHAGELEQVIGRLMEADVPEMELAEGVSRAILEAILATPARFEGVPPVESTEDDAPVVPLHSSVRGRRWWMAAAAVVLGLAGIGVWWAVHSPRVPTVEVAAANDMPPGGNRAMLTLGNGQKIVLDSAHVGLLAMQGSASVQKLTGGQLSYRVAGGGSRQTVYNTLSTPTGGQYRLDLPDGTKVWLNALSSITYPTVFAGSTRTVTIIGEAYFEVAMDKTHPFVVHVPGREEVTVLGTSFNINGYSDEPRLETTLFEGAVRVGGPSATAAAVVLRPGQQVVLDASGLKSQATPSADAVLAWKNGYFSLNGATTEEIMRQVARWYGAEVVYEGDVRQERFAGTVPRSANLSDLLRVLELTKTISFEIQDHKITVKPYPLHP